VLNKKLLLHLQQVTNMAINTVVFQELTQGLQARNITLVAVSKTKPVSAIQELYALGHRDFGENYVQELVEKQPQLPADIRWHFIGHLQTNKVKYIAPFVQLIQGVDSEKLLREINKQGAKLGRVINVLLQVHIAAEETKFGFNAAELESLIESEALSSLTNVNIQGLMGMASFTNDEMQVRTELQSLKSLFDKHAKKQLPNCNMKVLSMGMSGDYELAIACGSNMVRIGSLLFGARKYEL
jgi:pyridoxal phosphate enzyme (YggS family)